VKNQVEQKSIYVQHFKMDKFVSVKAIVTLKFNGAKKLINLTWICNYLEDQIPLLKKYQ